MTQTFADLSMPEFLKAFARASKTDSTRQRDLSEIARLKQNNDVMRGKLLQAIAERDHYLAALKTAGDRSGPGPDHRRRAGDRASAVAVDAAAAGEAESDEPPDGVAS